MAAPPCIAPEEETLVEENLSPEDEPEPTEVKPKSLLVEIFSGHEEFLGWTPD
jgi:hypothetical protein